jgi:hypothetical protein
MLETRNKILLWKSLAVGALSFPSPFLIIFYVSGVIPDTHRERFMVVIFLILSGAMLGVSFFYRDPETEKKKDWFPSKN